MSLWLSKKIALGLYNIVWGLAIPSLRWNRRLAQGFEQRTLVQPPPLQADIWIQAASVGESFLARELLIRLKPARRLQVLLTSNTKQGIDILRQAAAELKSAGNMISAQTAYFPFDKPAIMNSAVTRIRPNVMVLLEAELWPGHLFALKTYGSQILILNGRLTEKSLKRYRIWPSLWHSLRPDKILAISKHDAGRFAALFGQDRVDIMPNIKFDRISDAIDFDTGSAQIKKLLPHNAPFVILGSIRRQEEVSVTHIITEVLRKHKNTVTGLFPRHGHRINAWQDILNRLGIRWYLRSTTETRIPQGSVILWDTFGELTAAYRFSTAAFVGGSLAPLGGQNFLESLVCGIIPVTGPSWENFAWIGEEIVASGLLSIATDWRDVARRLIENIENPTSRQQVIERAQSYIRGRQGGADLACRHIIDMLERP
jgi:3-deoxy-D-manno-octulosonic-acid transferase